MHNIHMKLRVILKEKCIKHSRKIYYKMFIVTINILDHDVIPNIHRICADRLTKITWKTEGSIRSRIIGWKLT